MLTDFLLGLTAETSTTMKKLFGRRKQPEQPEQPEQPRPAVQLPEGGFDHPFQNSADSLV